MLVIIVGLIRLIAYLCSVLHLYLGKVSVVVHRLTDFLEPAILHLLEVIKDRCDLKERLFCGLLKGKTALCDAVHALLHEPPNMAIL